MFGMNPIPRSNHLSNFEKIGSTIFEILRNNMYCTKIEEAEKEFSNSCTINLEQSYAANVA